MMSSSSDSTQNHNNHQRSGGCCDWGKSGNWSGFNIASMVLGFIFFWPLGLFILFWNISGRSVKDLPNGIRNLWNKVTGGWGGDTGFHTADNSGNAIFNEYQQTQYDRIQELKDEIKERSRRFRNFRDEAKRRADKEEFNRFMSDAPGTADH